MVEPLVSVITIFYNAERFMAEAVESVLGQSYQRWELLLVDDGSTDGSTALAQQYAARYPDRLRYLTHEGHRNRGMSASRNVGIAAARGKLVAFLDADDVYLPEKLARQVAVLHDHPSAAMVFGPTEHWHSWTGQPSDEGRDTPRKLGVPADTLVPPPKLVHHFLRGTAQTPGTCGVLVRREAIARVGGFEEQFRGMFEDQVFFYKLCLEAPVFVSGEGWDRYRQHPTSHSYTLQRQRHNNPMGGYHQAYQRFLGWLERYLLERDVRDAALWQALRAEGWCYRHPRLHRLMRRLHLPGFATQWLVERAS